LLFVRLGASEALEAVEGLDEASKVAALKKAAKEALDAKIAADSSILQLADTDVFLGRICSSIGELKLESGNARYASCFMCKRYGLTKSLTNCVCLCCGTPICVRNRGREMTCLYEHLNSSDPKFKCNGTRKSNEKKNGERSPSWQADSSNGLTRRESSSAGSQSGYRDRSRILEDATGLEQYTDKVKL